MEKENIYQQILEYTLSEGEKAVEKYDKEHIEDVNWTVGWGDVYVVGDSGFAGWYRVINNTKENKVALETGGGAKYDCAKWRATEIQRALGEFGVDTVNDVHMD